MTHDVVVAGAGPVGLLLAIELATAGLKPLVLERLAEPSPALKALGVGAVGAEALERRGLAVALEQERQAMFARMAPQMKRHAGSSPTTKRPAGHFSALFLIDADAQQDPERLMRMLAQERLERILGDRAAELGIEIQRGVELEGFDETDAGLTVRTNRGTSNARYLVGCDGGRSRVRKLAGFDFVGTDPTILAYQAVVELDAPEKLAMGWHRTPRGLVANVMGRVFTVEFDRPFPERDAPVTTDDVEAAIQRVSGTDVKIVSMTLPSRWTDHARQATSYRKGRVFLAGDAAHVHSPFGGQGLNLGLVDAANLGWKLAAVIDGTKTGIEAEALLDSYTAERHPIGARVLENTRAQVALLRPDPFTTALRNIMVDVMRIPEANRYFGEMLSGVGTRYDLGDDDPLVGTLVKNHHLVLADGREVRLGELMTHGGGLLISPSETTLPKNVQHARTKEGQSMLVRPDGCIAWTDASSTSLDNALARWF